MKLFLNLLMICCLSASNSYSQNDTVTHHHAGIFDQISEELKNFKLDTSQIPDDKITHKIRELRNLRGGFNINEAIEFKIAEDRQKKEMSDMELDKLSDYFGKGAGRVKLDNAMIWIYRSHFSYSELKQLVKFYKSDAGEKMAELFPVIMLKSLAAAEMIKEEVTSNNTIK